MSDSARAVIERFNDAFNRHDVTAIMSSMTEDCVFENTRPSPDGTRISGQAAVRAYWEEFFARSPHAHFETEDIIAAGDRCTVRWTYSWIRDGTPGHGRGVDVFRVRGDGEGRGEAVLREGIRGQGAGGRGRLKLLGPGYVVSGLRCDRW